MNKKSYLDQYEQLLWTEIYRPRHLLTYLGHHTKPIRRLNGWFSFWSKKLKNDPPKKTRRQGRKRRRAQDEDDDNSDDDFVDQSSEQMRFSFNVFIELNFSSEQDEFYHQRSQSKEEHPQIIFIHGTGTTSLVHALAEEHQFKVNFYRFGSLTLSNFVSGHGNQRFAIKSSWSTAQTVRTSDQSSLPFDQTMSTEHVDSIKFSTGKEKTKT